MSSVVDELRRIADTNQGILQPYDVVEAAREPSSPLHDHFDWDDTSAAEKFRLWQARMLIRVCVTVVHPELPDREARVFVSLKDDRVAGGYRYMIDVLESTVLRKKLLRDALEEMESFQQKYGELKELTEVFVAMKRARRNTPPDG